MYDTFFKQYYCTNTKTMYVDITGDQENKFLKSGIDVKPQFSSSKCYSKTKVQLIDWAK